MKKPTRYLLIGFSVALLAAVLIMWGLSGPYITKASKNSYMANYSYWPHGNSPKLEFYLANHDEGISYHFQPSEGTVHSASAAQNNGRIVWDKLYMDSGKNGPSARGYLTVTLREGEHIVGYAVVRLDISYDSSIVPATPESYPVKETVLKSVTFPKQDGQYQPVTQEYVDKCAQQIINLPWN